MAVDVLYAGAREGKYEGGLSTTPTSGGEPYQLKNNATNVRIWCMCQTPNRFKGDGPTENLAET